MRVEVTVALSLHSLDILHRLEAKSNLIERNINVVIAQLRKVEKRNHGKPKERDRRSNENEGEEWEILKSVVTQQRNRPGHPAESKKERNQESGMTNSADTTPVYFLATVFLAAAGFFATAFLAAAGLAAADLAVKTKEAGLLDQLTGHREG